jgi:TonB family protein
LPLPSAWKSSDEPIQEAVKMVGSKTLAKIRSFHLLALFVLTVFLSPQIAAQSQPATPTVDRAITRLAAKIAESLQKAHATKIVVADLNGPERQTHPVGKWLTDQLSTSLQSDFPGLDVIARPSQESPTTENEEPPYPLTASAKQKEWARKLGASVIIVGSYARISKGIGVSLAAANLVHSGPPISQANGLIPISEEINALSVDPVPSLKGSIARAGTGGTSVPSCLHCPSPKYSDKARAAKYQGTVVLEVTVSAQGRAIHISVVKGPGMGLEEKSIEAVNKWKFKPAVDAGGDPVAVIVPIEVSFSLY